MSSSLSLMPLSFQAIWPFLIIFIYLFICNYYFSAYLLDAFKSSDFAVSLGCSFVSNSWELVPLMDVIVKTALW